MRFVVKRYKNDSIHITEYPVVVLGRDNWDDYGFKTTFFADLHLNRDDVLNLGSVKILQRGQIDGQTPLPETFEELDDTYLSLGQTLSYYEQLAGLDETVCEPVLEALKDIVFLPELQGLFDAERGMHDSLLRFDSATRALLDAPALFDSSLDSPESESVSFVYELPGGAATTTFAFGEVPELPNRVAVIIGYNGAGKTRLLANLAMLAHADSQEAQEGSFINANGRYVGDRPTFGAIVAVSYSAFDDFAIPGQGTSTSDALERERLSEGQKSARNYTYCGLRQTDENGLVQSSLKSIDQLTDEFHSARSRAVKMERVDSLREAMQPIYEEPSFRTIADLPDITADDGAWRASFAQLSTGHKIVLNIVIQLCANLERRSIVLLDEPELHLHPPLLAALLQATGVALNRHDSFGIVATHSPVVLQEVPARSVKVLRRDFDDVTVESPDIETFAENVGLLTQLVFNLDSSDTDFQGVLGQLARTHTIEEIEDLFDGRMSSQARSLLISMQHADD